MDNSIIIAADRLIEYSNLRKKQVCEQWRLWMADWESCAFVRCLSSAFYVRQINVKRSMWSQSALFGWSTETWWGKAWWFQSNLTFILVPWFIQWSICGADHPGVLLMVLIVSLVLIAKKPADIFWIPWCFTVQYHQSTCRISHPRNVGHIIPVHDSFRTGTYWYGNALGLVMKWFNLCCSFGL